MIVLQLEIRIRHTCILAWSRGRWRGDCECSLELRIP